MRGSRCCDCERIDESHQSARVQRARECVEWRRLEYNVLPVQSRLASEFQKNLPQPPPPATPPSSSCPLSRLRTCGCAFFACF